MYTAFKNKLIKFDKYLVLSFIVGLVPAAFINHIMAIDFSGFYFQAVSFLKYHSYSFQMLSSYCANPVNSGLNARAPLLPFLLALSLKIFGPTLLGIYLPFFIVRCLITPVTYLVARFFMSKRIAFLSASLLVFIPKLQTYSFGAFEADVFVAFFYVLALYWYLKSRNCSLGKYAMLAGIILGLCALSKSTGLAISVGFILAILLENINTFRQKIILKNIATVIVYFLLFIGPYLLWTLVVHHQLYITTQHDKSISYISVNLPSILYTIPVYFGINFSLGTKATFTSLFILFFLVIGIFIVLKKRALVLLLPSLVTVLAISTLSTCLIGGNIVGNIEFITLLGFTMIATSIIFFIGVEVFTTFAVTRFFRKKTAHILTTIFLFLLMYKFINNFFSARYALNFLPTEYYISIPTILKHREEFQFGDVIFKEQDGRRIFKDPVIHKEIRQQFTNFRFEPFSIFYKVLLSSVAIPSLIIVALDQHKKSK